MFYSCDHEHSLFLSKTTEENTPILFSTGLYYTELKNNLGIKNES